jgi:hypothetical protein
MQRSKCLTLCVLDVSILFWLFVCLFVGRGDCATCQIFLAGRATKPCVAKVPEAPKLKSLQEKGLEIQA